jgi:hypothetical protein
MHGHTRSKLRDLEQHYNNYFFRAVSQVCPKRFIQYAGPRRKGRGARERNRKVFLPGERTGLKHDKSPNPGTGCGIFSIERGEPGQVIGSDQNNKRIIKML